MTELVEDDADVEVAVAGRVRQVEDVLLHPRGPAVRRRGEVGVVAIAVVEAVLRVRLDGVAAQAAVAVVVGLEVPGDFVEAVHVVHVVGEVDGGEQVDLRDIRVLDGFSIQRRVEEEAAEIEEQTPVGAHLATFGAVRHVVVVVIQLGVDVVAASVGVFRECGIAVVVVPAVGRGERVVRVDLHGETAVLRVFVRRRDHVVNRVFRPVDQSG